MQRRVFLGLAAAGLAFWADSGAAVSPARAVIRLSCPDTDPGKALCRVMTQSLSGAAPGAVIRRVPQGDEAVTGPLDPGVAVHITAADAQGIGAQITWLAGPQGVRQTGREIRVDTGDTDLDQATLDYLARLAGTGQSFTIEASCYSRIMITSCRPPPDGPMARCLFFRDKRPASLASQIG